MTVTRIAKAASMGVALFLLAGHASAQDVSGPSDREVTRRIEFLQGALDAGRPAADLWWDGWLIGYGAATFGQIVGQYGTHDEKTKQDLLVGAVTTGLGAIGQLAYPLDAGRLAAQLRAMPDSTPEARQAKLAAAERFLRRSAAQEELGRSWRAHAISGAVNLAAGLVIWRHYDRPARDALLTFALGQLVSELQIFTQPTKAVRDLREYESRSDFGRVTGAVPDPRATWYVSAAPGSLLIGCRF